jgi:hypothetical protein
MLPAWRVHRGPRNMYILHYLIPPSTKHSSRRRTFAAAGAHDVVQHAVPDLLDHTDLSLNRFLNSCHEVRDGVEIHAVGVAVVRVGHGQDNGEG